MKGMFVYVRLETAPRQWLTHCLGNPVVFPSHSYENALLIRMLTKRPAGVSPLNEGTDPKCVPILIPDSSSKPSEYYNYLGRRGHELLVSAIDDLFRLALWSECSSSLYQGGVNKAIDEWCERNGIELDAREAVRQKFYRMRKKYQTTGIILGNFYKKHYHNTGKKRTP